MVMQPGRIKLLKFITALGMAGTEKQFMNLGRALDGSRFELHLACLHRWGHFLEEVEALGIPLVEYRITSLCRPDVLKEQLRFAAYIKRNGIQIVHTYGFYPNVFAIPAAWLAGVPAIVASIRDTGGYQTSIQRRVEKFVCWQADRIAVNAEAVRQWLIAQRYNPEKITVIPNGIDLSRFPLQRGVSKLREELGLPQGTPLIAVLSRLHPFKGIEYFLEAAAIVATRFPEARFLIVGAGVIVKDGAVEWDARYGEGLESYAMRLGLGGRVIFTGFRLDVPEWLSEITVSVLPSVSSEGLSNTVLESMAAGVPVVATTVGGNPELVQDGVTGLVVPPQDSGALARAVCRLLENKELALKFGQAARQRAAERFSVETMVRETEHLYLSLLEKTRKQSAVAAVRGEAKESRVWPLG